MKVLSLFSGIGAFEKALDNLEIPYELVGFSEIDKYAVKSYCAIHGVDESMNLGDITKIDENALPKNIDLITYGFPCQDISLAGKQKGLFNEDGTQTRSGLFFEALRIIEATQPRVAVAENVKNLTSKKFSEQFKIVLDSLEAAGYNNYWKVLNAKDYGIPQNRERVFIISIRKDIDSGTFDFPEGFPLQLRLKDLLEDEVDEKFYLSDIQVNSIKTSTYTQNTQRIQEKDWCDTLCARDWKDPKCVQVADLNYYQNDQMNRVYSPEGLAPTVKENHGTVTAAAMSGRYSEDGTVQQNIEVTDREYANAITTQMVDIPQTVKVRKYPVDCKALRIRKLTPKECFRLMGFYDSDFAKAEAVNSNTQLYKQAGNSIVVDVLEALFKSLQKAGVI